MQRVGGFLLHIFGQRGQHRLRQADDDRDLLRVGCVEVLSIAFGRFR